MSYCVNCGVKLKKSEKKCPLCNTPILNPNVLYNEYEPVYSNKTEKFNKINFKFISKMIVTILLLIALMIIACDYITSGKISWSVYVFISIIYFCCHFQYLIQKNIYVAHVIELLGAELFMFIIAYLNNGMHWYLYLVLPFIFIVWMYVIICTYLLKKKNRNVIRKILVCLFWTSTTLIIIESAIDLFLYEKINYYWSLFASVPIVIIGIIILFVSFNKRLVDEIKQRIFI